MTSTHPPQQDRVERSKAALAVGALAVVGMLGSIAMVVFHVDLGLPLVAVGFGVGALLFAVTGYGAFTRASWAWPLALVVNGLGLVSSVVPWRGLEMSGPPALVTLIAVVILLSRPGRAALLYHRAG